MSESNNCNPHYLKKVVFSSLRAANIKPIQRCLYLFLLLQQVKKKNIKWMFPMIFIHVQLLPKVGQFNEAPKKKKTENLLNTMCFRVYKPNEDGL